jgi:hypothetical protein
MVIRAVSHTIFLFERQEVVYSGLNFHGFVFRHPPVLIIWIASFWSAGYLAPCRHMQAMHLLRECAGSDKLFENYCSRPRSAHC